MFWALTFYVFIFIISFYVLATLTDKFDTKYPQFRMNYPILARMIRYLLLIIMIYILIFIDLSFRR